MNIQDPVKKGRGRSTQIDHVILLHHGIVGRAHWCKDYTEPLPFDPVDGAHLKDVCRCSDDTSLSLQMRLMHPVQAQIVGAQNLVPIRHPTFPV